jgi:replication fork clamp-binding protein CrfC
MVLDPKARKPARIGVRLNDKGRKVRFAKVSGEVLVAGKVVPKKGPKAAPLRAKEKAEEEEKVPAEVEKVAGPRKQPFWKRLRFGAEAVKEEVEDTRAVRPSDRSIPEQTRIPESFSHQRGD